jgi:Na+/H+ antiporter NhaD/arsenite permease-like protein
MRLFGLMAVAWAVAVFPGGAQAAGGHAAPLLGHSLSLGWVLPFALMLLAIASLPLAVPRWWESNRHKLWVSLVLGAPVLVLYLQRSPHALLRTGHEFASFMILLGSLYVISGGVFLAGDLRATPQTNTAFLAAGTVLASLIGTTGASLFLIRPVLRTNRERLHKNHTVVFFIFLVSNIGGSLTPLGDPPLFMGYLEGVPFQWTFRLAPEWLTVSGALLIIYFIWDSVLFTREPIATLERDKLLVQPLRLAGTPNLALLLAIILSVPLLGAPVREAVMVAAAALSLWITPRELRRANEFTAYPIVEVGVLFFGIFLTMIPALDILRARGGALGIRHPWQFFWASGALSSFLDNTPTYLVFLNLARGLSLPNEVAGVSHAVLRAISLGSVFMGANTYIGNAPNFMVKSVAEERGVKMPSFFGYMGYSAGVLIPVFLGVTFLFFLS